MRSEHEIMGKARTDRLLRAAGVFADGVPPLHPNPERELGDRLRTYGVPELA